MHSMQCRAVGSSQNGVMVTFFLSGHESNRRRLIGLIEKKVLYCFALWKLSRYNTEDLTLFVVSCLPKHQSTVSAHYHFPHKKSFVVRCVCKTDETRNHSFVMSVCLSTCALSVQRIFFKTGLSSFCSWGQGCRASVTGLHAAWSRVRIQNIQTSCGAHPANCLMSMEVLFH
jgi:hypothetical protein